MESWLKKVEEEESNKLKRKEEIREKIHGRRELILSNYKANKTNYDSLIQLFQEMVERVNSLPFKKRQAFGKIRFSAKTTRLQNHLYVISSSRKLNMNKLLLLTPSLRKTRLKHVRIAFLSVSKEKDHFDLEIKESLLEKRNIKKDDSNVENKKKDTHKRIDLLYHIPFTAWSEELAYEIIDWIAFQTEMEELSLDDFDYKDISDKPSYIGSDR